MADEDQSEGENPHRKANSGSNEGEPGSKSEGKSDLGSLTRRGALGAIGTAIGAGLFAGQVQAKPDWVRYWYREDENSLNAAASNFQHDAEIHARDIFRDRENDLVEVHTDFWESDWRDLNVPNIYTDDDGGGVGILADVTDPNLHIHVHGHLTPVKNARREFDTVGSHFPSADEVKTIGYSWDAYTTDDLFENRSRWKKNRTIARENGSILARTLLEIFREYEDRNVFLTGYSLGSQVVLQAIRKLSIYSENFDAEFGKNGGLINGVALLGAACPRRATMNWDRDNSRNWNYENRLTGQTDSVGPYGENILLTMMYEQDLVRSFLNFRSKADSTLGLAYPGGDGKSALGKNGPFPNGNNKWNADNVLLTRSFNCSDVNHSHWTSTGEVWSSIRLAMLGSGINPYGVNFEELPVVPGDHYRITAVHSGKVLEAGGDGDLIQDIGGTGDNQRWIALLEDPLSDETDEAIYKFRHLESGNYLRDTNSAPTIYPGAWTDDDEAKWRVKPDGTNRYTISSLAGPEVMTVENSSELNGARIVSETPTGDDNQQFRFNSLSGNIIGNDLEY